MIIKLIGFGKTVRYVSTVALSTSVALDSASLMLSFA
jgi:hypothetical protein